MELNNKMFQSAFAGEWLERTVPEATTRGIRSFNPLSLESGWKAIYFKGGFFTSEFQSACAGEWLERVSEFWIKGMAGVFQSACAGEWLESSNYLKRLQF